MKNLIKISTLALGLVLAQVSVGQIVGSYHDFSIRAFNLPPINPNSVNFGVGQICKPCHTPHEAQVGELPLWNHTLSSATFSMYSASGSTTFQGVESAQPDGTSKLCLACHDGTVALENYSGYAAGFSYLTGAKVIGGGGDLTVDHPVSFVYDAALAASDGQLFDPTTQASGLGGTIDEDMLEAGKLQCSSCHEVHGPNNYRLLRITAAASALCLTCHNK